MTADTVNRRFLARRRLEMRGLPIFLAGCSGKGLDTPAQEGAWGGRFVVDRRLVMMLYRERSITHIALTPLGGQVVYPPPAKGVRRCPVTVIVPCPGIILLCISCGCMFYPSTLGMFVILAFLQGRCGWIKEKPVRQRLSIPSV